VTKKEEGMREQACVHCGAVRAQHHQNGWCFFLSDTDRLLVQYSETQVSVMELVDEQGRPLVAPSDEEAHGEEEAE
jgi:hypothetical protein